MHRFGLRRLLVLSRPRFWVYLLGPYAVGLAAAGAWPSAALLLLGLYFTLPANLLIYGINDLFDRATDRLNPKKGAYEALLDPREDRRLIWAMVVLNVPVILILPFLPAAALLWFGVFLLLGVGYSAPPLRFKARPGLDAASNFLYAAPGLVAYTAASGLQPSFELVAAAALWCAAMHAYSAAPDTDSDAAAGISTVATALGAGATVGLCIILWLTAAVLVAPWLPLFALVAAAAYTVMGGLSYIAVRKHQPARLFALYRLFPYVNTAIGAALFFAVL